MKPRQLQDHLHQHGYCVEYGVVEKLHRRWKESRLNVVEATPDHSMFMELDELWQLTEEAYGAGGGETPFQVFVCGDALFDGRRSITLDVKGSQTSASVLEAVKAKAGIDGSFRLLHAGKQLAPEETMAAARTGGVGAGHGRAQSDERAGADRGLVRFAL